MAVNDLRADGWKISRYSHGGNVRVTESSQVRCCGPAMPPLRRLHQEDWEFETSLDYTVKPCLKNWGADHILR